MPDDKKLTLPAIPPLDEAAMNAARARMDSLVKPIGSLGTLESLAIRIAGMTGRVSNLGLRPAVIVFAADNGIHDEGITPVPMAVTAVQTANIASGCAGVSVLSRHANCALKVVDIGVANELDHQSLGVVNRRVRPGTANMSKGPAMSVDEAVLAIEAGMSEVVKLHDEGIRMIGVGEMGICNTSTSSAVLCCLTGCGENEATGRGAGIDDAAYEKKLGAIRRALSVNSPDPADPLDVLSKVGGLDIAAMCGAYIAAASLRMPAVVDGFISIVAALLAVRISPDVRGYLLLSHSSEEIGYRIAAGELGFEAMLNLHMRLGEGSGCPLAFHIIEASQRVLKEMATLAEGNVNADDLVDIRRCEEG